MVSTDRSLRSLLDHRWARSLLDHRGYGSITGGAMVVSTDRSLRSLLDHRWARSLLDHRGYGSITGGASGGLDYPRLVGETRCSTTGIGLTTGDGFTNDQGSTTVIASVVSLGRRWKARQLPRPGLVDRARFRTLIVRKQG